MRPGARLDSTLGRALAAAALAGAIWLAIVAALPDAFRGIDERLGDGLWRLSASTLPERRILLVDIDEPSLREIGPWPWPRKQLARLADRLAAEGAALQIYDIVLAAPAAGDDELAARLAAGAGVLAQVFALQPGTAAASGQPAAALPWAACPANLPRAQGYIGNPPAYAGLPVGHIAPLIENDGIVRRQPALICHEGKTYPALFVAALARALAPGEIRLQAGEGPLAPAWRLLGPALSDAGIPLDARGNVRIPWTLRPEAFVSLSARDILAGRVPDGLLRNAWVVVGSTALGLNDRVATPFGGHGAGFAIHAQLLRGALDDRLPVEPADAIPVAVLAALAATLALVALGRRRRAPVYLVLLAGLGLALLLGGAHALLLLQAGLWLPWTGAAAFVLLFALAHSLLAYAGDRLESERLYRHLASYLPGPVAAALARKDPSDSIDAERATITALHADIRNFSAYCESRPPEEATAVLHAFFSLATRCVESHGGIVESFQGDAVLATWGAPVAGNGGRHAESALAAALDLLRQSRDILPQDLPDGLAPLAIGIGLETGLATVGSFGLARRRTHLAMGRTVTAAARLQEMTAELAHPILLGEGIAAILGPHRLESQGVFLLEGLKIPCHIYAWPLRECL